MALAQFECSDLETQFQTLPYRTTPMDSSELIGCISAGPNAALLAAIGRDESWNVAADWGFGSNWKAERVPVGIKFRHSSNGLVTEEVLIARAADPDRVGYERLLALSQVPARLVVLPGPHAPRNRLASHFLHPGVGRDC
jgi:hypothetical protein